MSITVKEFPITKRCNFAHPGTWGHECGREATQVFVFHTELTHDGIYFSPRCEECAKIIGGENSGVIRKETFANQSNKFR